MRDADADPAAPLPEDPALPERRSLIVTMGTAAGAAMLGFEQAIRSEPPAQIMAAEHMPERGAIGLGGATGDLVIEIPEPTPPSRPDR
jgi:hypothetical protein